MSNGKKTSPKRPPKNAPAKPPSVPKPGEVGTPAKASAPTPKRAGKKPPDPVARKERQQRTRWILAVLGLVVLLAVLVLANAWLLNRQGAPPGGTATPVATTAVSTEPAAPTGTAAPGASATP